ELAPHWTFPCPFPTTFVAVRIRQHTRAFGGDHVVLDIANRWAVPCQLVEEPLPLIIETDPPVGASPVHPLVANGRRSSHRLKPAVDGAGPILGDLGLHRGHQHTQGTDTEHDNA